MFDPVKRLVHTSADDCRISLQHCHDLAVIEEATSQCLALGYKTKVGYLNSRAKQLRKLKQP